MLFGIASCANISLSIIFVYRTRQRGSFAVITGQFTDKSPPTGASVSMSRTTVNMRPQRKKKNIYQEENHFPRSIN